ncbi:MAG: alpha/beta fold hydrolase, partial [Pseudodonghicola sp.]
MTPAPAPFFAEAAGGPAGGAAFWLGCPDGVCIRIACWRPEGAVRGTVLLFPGRTEYAEKYGPAAGDLAARGLATVAIDWRGQGLADRLLDDPRPGYVGRFSDYQQDVAAVLAAAATLDLPRPFFLLAHSMGGCIGLRALTEGLPVAAAAFTGPMWGIRLPVPLRPLAYALAYGGPLLGLGHRLMPSTSRANYVEAQPFEDNALTTDPAMYRFMQQQLAAHPELGIGGPSLRWLREALAETAALARLPAPALPCVTFLGTAEAIVSAPAIRARMAGWDRGALELVEGARHEVMMERPEIRARV